MLLWLNKNTEYRLNFCEGFLALLFLASKPAFILFGPWILIRTIDNNHRCQNLAFNLSSLFVLLIQFTSLIISKFTDFSNLYATTPFSLTEKGMSTIIHIGHNTGSFFLGRSLHNKIFDISPYAPTVIGMLILILLFVLNSKNQIRKWSFYIYFYILIGTSLLNAFGVPDIINYKLTHGHYHIWRFNFPIVIAFFYFIFDQYEYMKKNQIRRYFKFFGIVFNLSMATQFFNFANPQYETYFKNKTWNPSEQKECQKIAPSPFQYCPAK